MRRCAVCDAERSRDGSKLRKCSRCRAVWCCCAEHQKDEWAVHKRVCVGCAWPDKPRALFCTGSPQPAAAAAPAFPPAHPLPSWAFSRTRLHRQPPSNRITVSVCAMLEGILCHPTLLLSDG